MTAPASRPLPDFSALLPRADAAGVVHLPQEGVGPIHAAAKALGYSCVEVDLAEVQDKEGLLTALAKALAFPPWFGHNWDALEDSLSDMSWREAEGYVLILRHADRLHSEAESDFLTALRILADVSTTWAEAGLPFWTFVELTANSIPLLPNLV
jgi:RNAse (barnase) inhibitor barstar